MIIVCFSEFVLDEISLLMFLVLRSGSEHSDDPNFYCRCNSCFSHVKHSMVTVQSVILAYGILVML